MFSGSYQWLFIALQRKSDVVIIRIVGMRDTICFIERDPVFIEMCQYVLKVLDVV